MGGATFQLPANTSAGALHITAHYSGTASIPAADSNVVDITVNKATSTTVLLIRSVRLNNGQAPVGAVEFRDGDTVLATVPVLHAGRLMVS